MSTLPFVGRNDELQQLRSVICDRCDPARIAIVTGPGGIGKTTLLEKAIGLGKSCKSTALQVDLGQTELPPIKWTPGLCCLPAFELHRGEIAE